MFGVIIQVRVVFRKTVVGDWCFDLTLDSEDDYRSGSQNISHQHQSFWSLYWYPWVQTIYQINLYLIYFWQNVEGSNWRYKEWQARPSAPSHVWWNWSVSTLVAGHFCGTKHLNWYQTMYKNQPTIEYAVWSNKIYWHHLKLSTLYSQ